MPLFSAEILQFLWASVPVMCGSWNLQCLNLYKRSAFALRRTRPTASLHPLSARAPRAQSMLYTVAKEKTSTCLYVNKIINDDDNWFQLSWRNIFTWFSVTQRHIGLMQSYLASLIGFFVFLVSVTGAKVVEVSRTDSSTLSSLAYIDEVYLTRHEQIFFFRSQFVLF